ncbi:S8 family serine peptidase [Ornithinimicrobium sp. W1679]|uniref:S8 family serine peptidase n=1 Tax=Ornithinimicrobium sp. W1679 TaxID=3418770 RepID=UPI003CEB0185
MNQAPRGSSPRRALAGVAALTMTGALLAPLSAGASEYLAPGSPAPESKIQGNTISGVEMAPHAFFVQFASAPTSEGGSLQAIQAERSQFLADAEQAGVDVEVRAEFDSLWNGVSVNASEDRLTELASSQVVEAIFPIAVLDAPEEPEATTIDPEMFTALSMTGADVAQSELGYTGKGIRVGVIDTGIDIDHPDLGGNGSPGTTPFPSPRVRFGYDFVGDAYNADPGSDAYSPQPLPDTNPDDCQGHGTHVAGIVGAAGEVDGVAPEVTFGAYRVFGCEGSTDADIMLRAMEKTLSDGMDVVNLSIGSAFSAWQEYPTAQATDALAREGVIVTASIGNSGDSGLHSAGAPGVGHDTIGVGSVDNVAYRANMFLDAAGEPVPYGEATGAPPAPTSGTEVVVPVGAPGSVEAQACTALPADVAAAVEGNVALIQRGTCAFHIKAVNAMDAGASGVIIYNNVAGAFSPTVAGTPAVTIPVVAITRADGIALYDDAAAGDGTTSITWSDEQVEATNPTGGLMSTFSSYGTTADLTFKPDISAPGGSIYSTYPLEIQPYATLSGTSMAAPHAAGAAALMLEARPGLDNEELLLRLQNTSDVLTFNLAPGAISEAVHKQGSGMIQVDEAIQAEVVASPGLIQLGQQLPGVSTTHEITLINEGSTSKTFDLGHAPGAASLGTANDFGWYGASAAVDMPASVTVPAGGTATVPVTITSPANGFTFGGYISFTDPDGIDYSVAYGGSAYDLQDVEVLADMVDANGATTVELPALLEVGQCGKFLGVDCVDEDGTYNLVDEGNVYEMAGNDVPTVALHFEHQARHMEWEVYRANVDGSKGTSVGVVTEVDYLARTGSRNGISAWTWDGRYVDADGARQRVDSGDYVLEVRVTKASAWNDDRTPGVETWASPYFTVAWEGGLTTDTLSVTRALGNDRYMVASELAVENFDAGVETVYVANGLSHPDALSGGALAAANDSPVVLVKPGSIPASTRMALQQLKPQRIVVLGGDAAVSEIVATQLRGYAGTVERLAGPNRYATSAAVSGEYDAAGTVFIASGENFPDALSASAAAGVQDAPLMLVKSGSVPSVVAAELDRLQPQRVVLVGGPAAVSDDVLTTLDGYADQVERIGGANRYEVSAGVAKRFFDAPVAHALVATGLNFPDALAAGPVAAQHNSPVLLVKKESVPSAVLGAIVDLRVQQITIAGGYAAVDKAVEDQLDGVVYP